MSIATDNRVTELENQVQKLIKQVQELTSILKPVTADTIQHKRLGRPPKIQGHMQP